MSGLGDKGSMWRDGGRGWGGSWCTTEETLPQNTWVGTPEGGGRGLLPPITRLRHEARPAHPPPPLSERRGRGSQRQGRRPRSELLEPRPAATLLSRGSCPRHIHLHVGGAEVPRTTYAERLVGVTGVREGFQQELAGSPLRRRGAAGGPGGGERQGSGPGSGSGPGAGDPL